MSVKCGRVRSKQKTPERLPNGVIIESTGNDEQSLLDSIESYLSSMKWPVQEQHLRKNGRWSSTRSGKKHVSGRVNIGGKSRKAFVLGKVRKWDDHIRLHESVHNKKHPDLFEMLKKLISTHNPRFKYNAIQLNNNVVTTPHYDKRNKGCSYCLALGKFKGGGLRIFDGEQHYDIHNKRKWVLYNGQTTLHGSVPVSSGTRFAIIFYMYDFKRAKAPRRRSS
jgi:hypothetical protein